MKSSCIIPGQRFGMLTAVSLSGRSSKGYLLWKCKCECGRTVDLVGAQLDQRVSCGCVRTACRIVKVGDRLGRLVAVEYLGRKNNRNLEHQFKFKCDCGKFVVHSAYHAKHSVRSCGCLRSETAANNSVRSANPAEATLSRVKAVLKYSCLRRGLKLGLSDEEIMTLVKSRCYYCGNLPRVPTAYKNSKRKDEYVVNGIDRINSSIGYVASNVVPCCSICNIAKASLSIKEFGEWILRISLNLKNWHANA